MEYYDDEEEYLSRNLRDFEIRLMRVIRTFGKGAPRKGVFIRAHLLDTGSDFVFNIYRRYKEFIRLAQLNINPGTYETLRKYFGFLKRLKLVVLDREEVVRVRDKRRNKLFKRRYYKVNMDLIDSPAWTNPKKAIYGY